MPKISVVVPVYNVEKYLAKCIDSILNQTFCDFELILVDDGSSDNCGTICDEYAMIDKRVRVIHQKNSGVSNAKNTGIAASNGEYLFFVDSDDYVASDCLTTLVDHLEKDCCDLVTIGYTEVNESYIELRTYYPEPGLFSLICTHEKWDFLINYTLAFKISWGMSKLYKSEIIKSNQIKVCETCENYAEDLSFLLVYIMHCSKICSIKYAGYYYLRRDDSMMGISEKQVRINSMNEVAYAFWYHLKNMVNGYQPIIKCFPILHFLIMRNQLITPCASENDENFIDECKRIKKMMWYKHMVIRSIRFRRHIKSLIGKYNARWYLNVYYYSVHKNRKLFLLCELIINKLHRTGKKNENN